MSQGKLQLRRWNLWLKKHHLEEGGTLLREPESGLSPPVEEETLHQRVPEMVPPRELEEKRLKFGCFYLPLQPPLISHSSYSVLPLHWWSNEALIASTWKRCGHPYTFQWVLLCCSWCSPLETPKEPSHHQPCRQKLWRQNVGEVKTKKLRT